MLKLKVNVKKIWIFSLALYIICSTAFSYGSLRMLNSYALYLFLGVSAFCVFFKRRFKFNGMVLSLILYAILMAVGTLYTPADTSVAEDTLYLYITMAVVAICAIQCIDDQQDIKHIMTAFMWAGVALVIYVYAQYGNEFWALLQENENAANTNINRLGDEYVNANMIGMCAAISVIIAVFKLIYEKNPLWKKVLYAAIIVFCFIMAMASASKKGVLMLAVAAFGIWLYSAFGNRNILRQLRNILILCFAFVAVYLLIINVPIFSGIALRIESLFETLSGTSSNKSDLTRMYMVEKGIEVWWDHPIFGAGTVASDHYFGVYAHNNYVELLMNSGMVGLIVFYMPQFSAFANYFINHRVYKSKSKHSALLFALLLAIFACSVGMVYYYERYFMVLIAVIVSATTVLKRTGTEQSLQIEEDACESDKKSDAAI